MTGLTVWGWESGKDTAEDWKAEATIDGGDATAGIKICPGGSGGLGRFAGADGAGLGRGGGFDNISEGYMTAAYRLTDIEGW